MRCEKQQNAKEVNKTIILKIKKKSIIKLLVVIIASLLLLSTSMVNTYIPTPPEEPVVIRNNNSAIPGNMGFIGSTDNNLVSHLFDQDYFIQNSEYRFQSPQFENQPEYKSSENFYSKDYEYATPMFDYEIPIPEQEIIIAADQNYQLESSWLHYPVDLDGEITCPKEWTDAITYLVSLDRAWGWPDKQTEPDAGEMIVRFKNDGEWLYLLYQTDLSTVSSAHISFFEAPYVPPWEKSDSGWLRIDNSTEDVYGWDDSGWLRDVQADPPGENNTEGAVQFDGEFYWFEFRKKLDSGDGRDWSLSPGDLVGINDDAFLVALWEITLPSTYEKRITLQLNSNPLIPHDPIYIYSDDDFITYGFEGTGEIGDPYIIEGYEIITNEDYVIHIQGTTKHFIVRNCYVEGNGWGIVANNTAYNTAVITNNRAFHCRYGGIALGWSSGAIITDNICYGNMRGIYYVNASNGYIKNNTCIGNREIGIYIRRSLDCTVTDNTLCKNSIDGISLFETFSSEIDNNFCYRNLEGIAIVRSADNLIYSNILVVNNVGGIFLQNSFYINIYENTCEWNLWNGIQIYRSDFIYVTNNLCNYNGEDGIRLGGYELEEGSDHLRVLDNTCNYNGLIGIRSTYGDSIDIISNECNNNGDDGIYVNYSFYSTIEGNTCNNNNVDGIGVENSFGCDVSNNFCENNRLRGILLRYTSFSGVVGNTCRNNFPEQGVPSEGAGILVSHGESVKVIDNICEYNNYGIRTFITSLVDIRRNIVSYNWRQGIAVYSSDSCDVIDNTLEENQMWAIVINAPNSNVIGNMLFENLYGIVIFNADYCTVTYNVIDCNLGSAEVYVPHGIGVYDSNYPVITNNHITESTNGIYLENSEFSVIQDNSCERNTFSGIYLNHSNSSTISGNSLYENYLVQAEPLTGLAIILDYCSDVTITDNTGNNNNYGIRINFSQARIINNVFSNNYRHGIFLGTSEDTEIIDNTCEFNAQCGIVVGYSSHNAIVTGNTVTQNAFGISIDHSNNCIATDNFISDNTVPPPPEVDYIPQHAIGIWDSVDSLVYKNECNNSVTGIYLENLEFTHVLNNTCKENLYGIRLVSSSSNNVSFNILENNMDYAIIIETADSINNTIYWNNILFNNLGGNRQAIDNGYSETLPNVFDYNYWSDWLSPDIILPFGIVDVPYPLEGTVNNQDPHPRTIPGGLETVRLNLKLSGEFDFLLKEEIHLQLAALVTERYSGKPLTGATVSFTIYDPEGQIFQEGYLIEEVEGSGVYIYTDEQTMKDLKIPKGIYLVIAETQFFHHPAVTDMIQFHVDPPSETSDVPLILSAVFLGLTVSGVLVYLFQRRIKFKL